MWLNFILTLLTYGSISIKLIRSTLNVNRMKTVNTLAIIMSSDNMKVTKKFSVFLLAMVVQWMPLSIYLLLNALNLSVPQVLINYGMVVNNLGGFYNFCIYFWTMKGKFRTIPTISEVSRKC